MPRIGPCRDPAGHRWVRGGRQGFPDSRGVRAQLYRCTNCGRRTQIPPPLLEREIVRWARENGVTAATGPESSTGQEPE